MQTLVTLEEHTLPGGLGSYLMELASEKGLSAQIHRLGLDLSDGYPEEYSGRETLHRMYGIDAESIVQLIKRLEK